LGTSKYLRQRVGLRIAQQTDRAEGLTGQPEQPPAKQPFGDHFLSVLWPRKDSSNPVQSKPQMRIFA
jgi:hypothetical protein